MPNAERLPVAFVLKGYPRLSESFIAQEIYGLEQRGLLIHIISLRHPTDKQRHPVHSKISAPVLYLPEYLHQEPMRVMAGWRFARQLPGYARAFSLWLRDLRRDMSRNRVRRFGQAMTLVREIGTNVAHLHAHFLHTPSSVTRYAAIMLGATMDLLCACARYLDQSRLGTDRKTGRLLVGGHVYSRQPRASQRSGNC